jgi:RNA polymerase sigma factor (sigma-70 family)
MIDYLKTLQGTAGVVLRKYRTFVALDDLVSVGWTYLLEHPEAQRAFDELPEEKLAIWRLQREMWRVMDRYARKQKAAQSGYEPEDEASYSRTILNVFLPYVLNNDRLPPVRDQPEGKSTRDPAEGSNWLVMWLDVAEAWASADLTASERELLVEIYLYNCTQEDVGERLGLSQATVSRRHQTAIGKLQERLGGPIGADCPYDCECHEGPLRKRPGTAMLME